VDSITEEMSFFTLGRKRADLKDKVLTFRKLDVPSAKVEKGKVKELFERVNMKNKEIRLQQRL